MEVLIKQLTSQDGMKVFKLYTDNDTLGCIYVKKSSYIWVQDLFAKTKISRRTALNHFNNDTTNSQRPNL
jgi:hypothetical protein